MFVQTFVGYYFVLLQNLERYFKKDQFKTVMYLLQIAILHV